LILWGLFVKVVIADRLSIYVDIVYNSPEHHSAISSLVATLFFTFQIYCDFSGYSSIAIGCAKVLGIDLMINFRRPYMSTSIREFWSRWHISLSTWFRDYLYIPLGGNRVSLYRNMFNLFFVFLVSGLWHGANWTFIIWGALHGFYLIMEIVFDRLVPSIKLPRSIRWILNFVLVAIAWVFFRASNFQTAKQILKNIYTFKPGPLYIGNASYLVYSFFAILFLFAAEYNAEKLNNRYAWLYSERKVLRWSAYLLLILTLLSIGVFNGGQFIYFQF
jgi:D-alanyl-lipoteichoic acid acyltransferase DltB (MBOAT superfamily)